MLIVFGLLGQDSGVINTRCHIGVKNALESSFSKDNSVKMQALTCARRPGPS